MRITFLCVYLSGATFGGAARQKLKVSSFAKASMAATNVALPGDNETSALSANKRT